MATHVGTASTIGELKALLTQLTEDGLPDDFPVRSQSLSHTFPVDVEKHELCILLTF